jgi:CubicO group peptidase (beta-lactamase class C family)
MQLAEEGSLSLDDSLFDHLPEFAQSQVAVLDSAGEIVGTRPAARGITIADLLAHTSGLCYAAYENGPMGRVYEAAALDTVSGSNRALARALAALPLAFDPGSEWRYGRSTDVLGALIEEVEGASLQAVLVQRVFEPLGMDDTAFFVPLEKRGRLCAGETSGSSAASASEPPLCSAGGGLYSSADDYLRFCEMLLGQGTREDVRILSPASVRLLTTDRIAGLPRPDFLGERGFGLGFAVLTEQSAGPLNGSVGSFHWSGAFGTSFFVDPTEQLIGVFLVHQYRDFSYMVAFRKAVYAALPDYDPGSPSSGNEVGE